MHILGEPRLQDEGIVALLTDSQIVDQRMVSCWRLPLAPLRVHHSKWLSERFPACLSAMLIVILSP